VSAVRAIYPGSFDPFTNGHLDILERGLKIFSEVTLVVAGASRKNPIFTPEQRVELIREVVSRIPSIKARVKVDVWSGLIMDYAKKIQASVVIRGIRAVSDFDHEFMMAAMNRDLNSDVDTVLLMSSKNLYFVSSTIVKEIFDFGGDISPYVPPPVCT